MKIAVSYIYSINGQTLSPSMSLLPELASLLFSKKEPSAHHTFYFGYRDALNSNILF